MRELFGKSSLKLPQKPLSHGVLSFVFVRIVVGRLGLAVFSACCGESVCAVRFREEQAPPLPCMVTFGLLG